MMNKSKRSFLKVAGIAAIGLGASPAINLASSDLKGSTNAKKAKNKQALSAHRWGMVIDTNKICTSFNSHLCFQLIVHFNQAVNGVLRRHCLFILP